MCNQQERNKCKWTSWINYAKRPPGFRCLFIMTMNINWVKPAIKIIYETQRECQVNPSDAMLLTLDIAL